MLYDISQIAAQLVRVVLVIMGLGSLYRIIKDRYMPGDYACFALGAASATALNQFFWRVHSGVQRLDGGNIELTISNFFYVIMASVLAYFVISERKFFK